MTTVLTCTAVLFDCDGVLVDSDSVVVRSWTRWAQRLGLEPDVVLATVHGRRAADTVAEFVEPAGREAALALIDALELEDADDVTVIPGAAALLASMPADRWATVTSGSPVLARARLVAAGLPVPEVLVTSADVTHGKPHPEGYLAAAAHLGVPADECLVLEDSPAGIRAAQAAQVRHVVRVGDRELGDLRADAEVPDLRSLRWMGDGLEVH
ncbi:MAG: phosphatase [Cellulomonas sp. 73-145]|uniref:HAD-IA family hydrolase n=1 Tax=Cellulomonas sp. 73-145 TaxID=1895739 RepID=UPI000925D240|nr:HAD-IA family hydrolase [Cellulomonas sp. 73-145]MBN9327934.1 HAD-IA family hydrolase [Cellulomonas sp.]OJV58929.1 MAG: phosphatase [Cellulomonas sp. 73-145]